MDILLIAGLWLDAGVWDQVTTRLESRGHHAVPVPLPGQGDGNLQATLEDQVAAVVAAVDAAGDRPVVVGHSAAGSLAWLAADARPERVRSVVLIGGFPAADGKAYFDASQQGPLAFPGWAEFEGPDSADLDAAAREAFERAAIPVPEEVVRGIVRLRDRRRYDVPVVLVCPEFSPDQARRWIAAGELPELAAARQVSFLDIDSGHWPMITAPDRLAEMLSGVAEGS